MEKSAEMLALHKNANIKINCDLTFAYLKEKQYFCKLQVFCTDLDASEQKHIPIFSIDNMFIIN